MTCSPYGVRWVPATLGIGHRRRAEGWYSGRRLRTRPAPPVIEPATPAPPKLPTPASEAAGAEREGLREAVHGRRAVCADCGIVAQCDVATLHPVADIIDGRERIYGRCPACAAGGDLARQAIALLLDVDPDAIALDGLTVELFAQRPGSATSTPNTAPWGHLNRDALARRVAARRLAYEARRGGPCEACGVTVTPRGAWQQSNTGDRCGACQEWFGGLTACKPRDLAAAVLLGQATLTMRHGPLGLGEQVGLLWWAETGRSEGNAWPFEHLDWDRIRAMGGGRLVVDPRLVFEQQFRQLHLWFLSRWNT